MEINTCEYLTISNKTTKVNVICFCVYVQVDCCNYLFFVFILTYCRATGRRDTSEVKSSLIPLAVKHKFSIDRDLLFHRTEACQPAKYGDLRHQLHTEEVDHPFLWNPEAGLFVVGCPALL